MSLTVEYFCLTIELEYTHKLFCFNPQSQLVSVLTPCFLQGVYGENGSVLYHHPGYGFASQPAYGPYNPGAPIPTMGADGQLYGPQAFQYPGHMYQQPVSPGGQYMSTPTSMAGDAPTSGPGEPGPPGVEGGNGTMANGSNVSMGPRPGYPVTLIPSHGPYARGVLPLAIHSTLR